MTLNWTRKASRDLLSIHEYISAQSPAYADSVARRISARPKQAIKFPEIGSIVAEFDRTDIREPYVLSYRVIYQIAPEQIRVLAVIHGARLIDSSDIEIE